MLELLEYVLLGLIQGATEFLPISSSAHLVAASKLLHVGSSGLLLGVCLHFGTFLAILIVLRRDVWKLVGDAARGVLLLLSGRREEMASRAPMFPLALAIVIGSVPACVLGLSLHEEIREAFESIHISGAMLMITGLFLLLSRLAPQGTSTTLGPMTGLLIGVAQAIALLPGISRSGATIVAALFLGIERNLAARFSFLLALPALAGAMVAEVAGVMNAAPTEPAVTQARVAAMICGAATAALVGSLCLTLFLGIVQRGKLHWFGAYCLPMGILMLVLGQSL